MTSQTIILNGQTIRKATWRDLFAYGDTNKQAISNLLGIINLRLAWK